jgi:hypothetical protein
MKKTRKTIQIQTELFCERKPISDQILHELSPDRQLELERRIMELLLNVALGDEEVPRRADHDA